MEQVSNRQLFYHRMEILFTATEDVSDIANNTEFQTKLAGFLKRNLKGGIIEESVEFDAPVNTEPGDPTDLM